MCLRSVGRYLCSDVCLSDCRRGGLALLVYISDVLLLGTAFFSPLVVSVRLRMFDLSTLGSGSSKDASGRTQIHPIWRTWHFRGGVFVSWLCQTGFLALRRQIMTQGFSSDIVGPPQEFVCDSWMFEECAPPIPFFRLLGRSGFGDSVGSVEGADLNYIQEIKFLGGCLMCINAAVCCGSIWLNFFVSVWYDLWKSCERESTIIFSVPLISCEYRDVSLMTSVHPN